MEGFLPGHAKAGVEVARNFISRLTDHKQLTDEVLPLVKDHMTPLEFHHNGAGDSAIRRLAQRVKRIDRLVQVSTAKRWTPTTTLESSHSRRAMVATASGKASS